MCFFTDALNNMIHNFKTDTCTYNTFKIATPQVMLRQKSCIKVTKSTHYQSVCICVFMVRGGGECSLYKDVKCIQD